jgi:N-methylhydantoinase A/oxoprolinase/acetone carboxylase beta subunit
VRIGIDVGGTFTHAAAIESNHLTLLGKFKVPTSHRAKEGVALGVVEALNGLLTSLNIKPDQVQFIAHSTTQATNALLEGDVAPVGIIGMGSGLNATLARLNTNLGDLRLAPGRSLKTYYHFIDTSKPPSRKDFEEAFDKLSKQGAKAFAISEAFSVDQSQNEALALEVAERLNLIATAGSTITQLYGLRIRTRTAVLNAAMMPKMLESAELTERCVKEANINAPLMIMRSDGGVMDIASMRRKPILTMLSGPAAGVAAALMFLKISDGIFLEVGGTSTDISAIHNGRAKIRSAEVGGNQLLMKTLDVRTVGAAGGSLARLNHQKIVSAGPRSAHIAGFNYVAFAEQLNDPTVSLQSPLPGDPDTYIAIKEKTSSASGPTYCLTPTCAANLLGFVPPENCAAGNLEAIGKSFEALGKMLGKSAAECAEEFLSRAADKCAPIVRDLIRETKLDDKTVTIYGGGGGAAAIVPYLAKRLKLNFELAAEADVISAIGVALAMVRDTIERHVVAPSNEDILRIRQDAYNSVRAMGAADNTIDVFVEYDSQLSILRGTAVGSTSSVDPAKAPTDLSDASKLSLVARSMRLPEESVSQLVSNQAFSVYAGQPQDSPWLEFFTQKRTILRVIDQTGTIRFQSKNGDASLASKAEAESAIAQMANKWARWGDAGKSVPNILLLAGNKILDLSGLADLDQILTLARLELEKFPNDAKIIVLATPNY